MTGERCSNISKKSFNRIHSREPLLQGCHCFLTLLKKSTLRGSARPVDEFGHLTCTRRIMLCEGRSRKGEMKQQRWTAGGCAKQPCTLRAATIYIFDGLSQNKPLIGYAFATCNYLILFECPADQLAQNLLQNWIELI